MSLKTASIASTGVATSSPILSCPLSRKDFPSWVHRKSAAAEVRLAVMASTAGWTGDIYPVFVTAPVPLSMINRCLVESAEYAENWDMADVLGLYLISNATSGKPKSPSRGPLDSFSPPTEFASKSLSDLKAIYLQHWAGEPAKNDRMSSSTFAVLDGGTITDSTALLVSVTGRGVETARCELSMVSQLLNGPEQGTMSLVPSAWASHREKGVLVYRRSWYDRLFPSIDLNG